MKLLYKLLYYFLRLQNPFRGANETAQQVKVLTTNPDDLSSILQAKKFSDLHTHAQTHIPPLASENVIKK